MRFLLHVTLVASVATATTRAQDPSGISGPAPATLHALENVHGSLDLWTVPTAFSGAATRRVLARVNLLPLELEGYAVKDELRLDLPTRDPRGVEHVALPGGGALLRGEHGGLSVLLHATPAGEVRTVHSVPLSTGIGRHVHVDPSGRWFAVAAGDDAWVVDLAQESAPYSPTAGAPVTDLDATSLRVSRDALFFVADDALFRATLPGGTAVAVDLGLNVDEEILPEGLLSADGRHLALVTEREDHERRLFVVPVAGAPLAVTPTPTPLFPVRLRDDLGPYVALSADGTRVAWVAQEPTSEELYARQLADPANLHLTVDPDFPAYVDNVGVLSFADHDTLCVVAGDVKLAGTTNEELIGAAEMYALCFEEDGTLEWMNLTRTNGQAEPPFSDAASMVVGKLRVDPAGTRALVVGESELEDITELTCFRTDGVAYHGGANLQTLLANVDDEVELVRAGEHVAVVSRSEDDESVSLHVLQPFVPYGQQILSHVETYLPDVALSRWAWGGGRAGFVQRDGGSEQLFALDLDLATTWSALPPSAPGVLPAAFSLTPSGELRATLTAAGGTSHVAIPSAGAVVALRLPATSGGFTIPLR